MTLLLTRFGTDSGRLDQFMHAHPEVGTAAMV